MKASTLLSSFFYLLFVLLHGAHNLDYSDLEALELSCPSRDSCRGYRNTLSYLERSCECDSACDVYRDCCIDASARRTDGQSSAGSTTGNGMMCMHYGLKPHAGVYVLNRCSRSWNGSPQVRAKCEESEDDLSDPLLAAPATSITQAMTYRNRYCAECNGADPSTLVMFQILVGCEGLPDLSYDQMLTDLKYNQTLHMWGVNRLNFYGNQTLFYGCDISFDVPSYLNSSVRFCRSDLISSCPQSWTRSSVRKACEDYMTMVFDNLQAYRNPHCAICNGKTVDELSCSTDTIGRERPPFSFVLLLDMNRQDGEKVGMRVVTNPACATGQKYDPFYHKCRTIVCALPHYVIENGKCVPGT